MINVYFSELPKTLTEILELKYDETMSYEERVQKRYDYIKQQYELDNKYEGWDYIEHISFGSEVNHLITFEYMISTKGRILSLNKNRVKYRIINGVVLHGYKRQALLINKIPCYFMVHRLSASTFVPNKCFGNDRNLLCVNHKDLTRLNNHFTNLEWCTQQENVRHGLLAGAWGSNSILFDKHLKGTWKIDDKYKDIQFRIKNHQEFINLGFNYGILNRALLKPHITAMGCLWETVTEEEYHELPEIPFFILSKMLHDPLYIRINIRPLLGTIKKEGKCEGEQFVIYGSKELEGYGFNPGNTFLAAKSRSTVRGCIFEYVTRDEAELLPRGLTEEQMEYLGLKSKLYTM